MIVKSVRHANPRFNTLINYVLDGMDMELDERRWVLFHNMQNGHERRDIIDEFEINAQPLRTQKTARKKTYKYHEILAFSEETSMYLTNDKLQDIARIYMKIRDPKQSCKAIAAVHWEKKHVHIHLVISSNHIGSDRSSDMRMDNKNYYEIRRNLERETLGKYPELVESTVYLELEEIKKIVPRKYHSKIKTPAKESKNFGKQTKKQLVSTQVQKILDESSSLNDFQNRLKNNKNLQPYFRNDKLQGVIADSKKYRLKTLGIELLPEKMHILSRLNELDQISKFQNRDCKLER